MHDRVRVCTKNRWHIDSHTYEYIDMWEMYGHE
jgi:hypothetical protein